ncbi:unnamed protein product [Urochloa humidicola]
MEIVMKMLLTVLLNSGIKVMLKTPDYPTRTACNCLKSAAGRISGLNAANAASIPSKCGVSIPYSISTSTDCSKVG